MRILLTNDDGIFAPGIEALHDSIRDLGEVTVVAPATVQSAESHGITFHRPLMTRRMKLPRIEGIAVEGTPADCVKLTLKSLWPSWHGAGSRPDLVISGMNFGANAGINVIYSGTVAAAIEAAFLGVPAIAVSLYIGRRLETHLPRAAEIARTAIDRVLLHPLDAHRVVNINVPITERADAPMPPMRVVSMNTAPAADGYERRTSPEGHDYYWPTGNGMEFIHTAEESDVEALAQRAVTITPLHFDLTDHSRLESWRGRLADAAAAR
ncbi:MAG: 5'/3'-nucleotidase SurE [Phycisphaeraceae bacterium]|nr:5'/3'-nucleotidase SurE [Phycisphaeraceae bacterium]